MASYDDLTAALQQAVSAAQRGYVLTTAEPIVVPLDKAESIMARWIDDYGTNLPRWKREARKGRGLPNALVFDMPVLGNPYKRQLLLLATAHDAQSLHPDCPFLREKWRPVLGARVGDFVFAQEAASNGIERLTLKLDKSVLLGQQAVWAKWVKSGRWDMVLEDTEKSVRLYPMFGGVRRQMRRAIGGMIKLYEKRVKKDWPGVQPDALPALIGFRARKPKV